MSNSSSHFNDLEPIEHVAHVQAENKFSSLEPHGTESSNAIAFGSDAAKESAFLLSLLLLAFQSMDISSKEIFFSLLTFSLAFLVWKSCRAVWICWNHLERLHRILEQERWEIVHNRQQEREELKALYQAKGFEGKLLEDVLDVLMADEERLLKVMVEEELGLSLQKHEHPIKQGMGAFFGVFLSSFIFLTTIFFLPLHFGYVAALVVIIFSTIYFAKSIENSFIPAIVWNSAFAILSFSTFYFILEWIKGI